MEINKDILSLDNALHGLVSGIEILDAISPLNYKEQKAVFFESKYSHSPRFVYKQNTLDAFALKRRLFSLPIESLQDDDLITLYTGVINSYIDKVDQVVSIGSNDFLYDSFRYYGEPSEKDLRNAAFVLHLPTEKQPDETFYNASAIETYLKEFAIAQGYEHNIRLDENMIANALASGTTIKINAQAKVNKIDMTALAHHELGVHLATTLNGRNQPLRILSLGCPANTKTQEGLAILSEYMAGCLTVGRLRNLALRVMAVNSMIKEKNFRASFLYLKEEFSASDEQAFSITARVYRGGGFTKDYVYLRGFHDMLNAYETSDCFHNLLCGKTASEYLPVINNLVNKGYLVPPKFITPAFALPQVTDSIQKFIAHAIK
ncbi:flavohemoglobin expression-modulating QEGLA motif protein [Glaciecola sp. XM2]|uniref:flavohemoglobin expression-modulating QEGLA motif protein n=1 Tax=Glaciecola sp. XM2 TaxID=1914931 RepID=UPI001BDE52E8|nr:flavohemoglobin expression-modulating QEGLA motif protein [Glaciecola sp. XM2]